MDIKIELNKTENKSIHVTYLKVELIYLYEYFYFSTVFCKKSTFGLVQIFQDVKIWFSTSPIYYTGYCRR